MIHRVIASGQVHSHGHDRKRLGYLINGRLISCEPDETGIKRVCIFTHRLGRVPLRVDRYKQHLHSGYRGCFFNLRQFDESGGTYVRAMRKSKEHEARLAEQVLLREGMAVTVV